MFWILLFLAQGAASNQLDRGEALFNDTTNGCVTCHALKGKGTAVGPDLKGVSRLSPKGIAMAIRSTATMYVQTAKVKSGGTFPAMPGDTCLRPTLCAHANHKDGTGAAHGIFGRSRPSLQ